MRKRRNHMPPMMDGGKKYECRNAMFWPPPEIEYLADTAEELRYSVPNVVYQRIKTWEKMCGIMGMQADKCPTCPLVIVDGKPATRTGSPSAKTIKNKRILRKG